MDTSTSVAGTLRAQTHGHPPVVLTLENHPNDSRVKIKDDGICQALTTSMGTGGATCR